MKIISTPCGQIQGVSCGTLGGVIAYKGIRYATAGRWEYPVQVKSWDGVYQADHYGNCSYQPRAFYDEAYAPEKAFYYKEFRKGETYTYSEDCLFLNIWTSEKAEEGDKLPVILYIHGGGFTGGCGHEKHFDGPQWAKHGVIAVTINYRLGPLGSVCLPELKEEAGHCGNYGLYDQIAAMRWVNDNISAFGGDPENVTLMGQSAGAMSVQQHCVSELTDGLFAKAVMSSGGGVSDMMNFSATAESRYDFWKAVMKRTGCSSLEQFRALKPETLFNAWQMEKRMDSRYNMVDSPCVDGALLTQSALEAANAGAQKNIPYMMGSNAQDMMPPMMYNMAFSWCKMQSDQEKQPSYCWFFERQLPGDRHGAWHSADLWYWFGTLKNGWRPFVQKDFELSEQMICYLTNFAKTGNPNGENLPQWQPVSAANDRALRFCDGETAMYKPSKLKLYYRMLHNKPVGE